MWPQWCVFSDIVYLLLNLDMMHIKLKLRMSAVEWQHLYYC